MLLVNRKKNFHSDKNYVLAVARSTLLPLFSSISTQAGENDSTAECSKVCPDTGCFLVSNLGLSWIISDKMLRQCQKGRKTQVCAKGTEQYLVIP